MERDGASSRISIKLLLRRTLVRSYYYGAKTSSNDW